MADDTPLRLRSPFNGEILEVPPENQSPAFVAALLTAGFIREDAPRADGSKKGKPSRALGHTAR